MLAAPFCGVVRRVSSGQTVREVPTGGELSIWRLAWTHDGRALLADALAVAPD